MLAKLRLIERVAQRSRPDRSGGRSPTRAARASMSPILRAPYRGRRRDVSFGLIQTTPITPEQAAAGYICVAILGGDDTEIAAVLREYIVPGISTYGEYDGLGDDRRLLPLDADPAADPGSGPAGRQRPRRPRPMGCPPPSAMAIRDASFSTAGFADGPISAETRRRFRPSTAFARRSRRAGRMSRSSASPASATNSRVRSTDHLIGFVEIATLRPRRCDRAVAPSATQLVPPFIAPAKAPAGFLP